MLSFQAARGKVCEVIAANRSANGPETEAVEIATDPARALGRFLAEDITSDRDYPPFDRSTRDGYAVRAADAAHAGAKLHLVGESRAGLAFSGTLAEGECIRILTGAPMPPGADAVIMQEYALPNGEYIIFDHAASVGQNFVAAGTESRSGSIALPRGTRIGYPELAAAAQVGRAKFCVAARPRVAILSTGDEIVDVTKTPGPFEIRNSNSISLAAQVAQAGGEAVMLGNAADNPGELRAKIELGFKSDILILSGGVSVGTYDFVEEVLRDLGAEFFFDSVAIQPGKPAVFGWCRGKPVFGLPGNPVSTMVTFELFVAPAIAILSGAAWRPLPLVKARLEHALKEKPPLAHFLPARITWSANDSGNATVEPIPWKSSGDIAAVVKSNCFLVVQGENQEIAAGEWADVWLRG
jgi:molybdopterin molybdotransferase